MNDTGTHGDLLVTTRKKLFTQIVLAIQDKWTQARRQLLFGHGDRGGLDVETIGCKKNIIVNQSKKVITKNRSVGIKIFKDN